MTNRNNNVNKPRANTTTNVAPDNAAAFEALISGGISVRRVFPVGQHDVTFNGITFDMAKQTMTISLLYADEEYLDVKKFNPEKPASILIPSEAIAKQFGLMGTVQFNQINEHIGEPLKVWAFIPEGYKTPSYNYYEPKVVKAPESAGPVNGTDY